MVPLKHIAARGPTRQNVLRINYCCFPLKHFDGLKVTEFSECFSRKHVGRDRNDLMMIAIIRHFPMKYNV